MSNFGKIKVRIGYGLSGGNVKRNIQAKIRKGGSMGRVKQFGYGKGR